VLSESVELPSGLRQHLLLIDHPGAVAVVAEHANGDIVAVRQYRHAIGDWLLEIPAGRVERGEDRLKAAQRELEEETGLRASAWRSLGAFYPAPGFCSEEIELFWASGLELVGPTRAPMDTDEELQTVRLPWERALLELAADGKSAVALARVQQLRAS